MPAYRCKGLALAGRVQGFITSEKQAGVETYLAPGFFSPTCGPEDWIDGLGELSCELKHPD